MSHPAEGLKHPRGLPHLAPIAPAPMIAPRPVQVLPKPSGLTPATSTSTVGAKQLQSSSPAPPMPDFDTQSLPCIITSKQWVLPPRPKAGRRPVNPDQKKKPQTPALQKRQNSMSSVTNNMGNLNIHKSLSENLQMNFTDSNVSTTSSTSTVTAITGRDDLKTQLESATQENQKLKSIISWLKIEIEQLQRCNDNATSPGMLKNNTDSTPEFTADVQASAAQIHYQLHGSQLAATPTAPSTLTSLTSREVSPSTVDPKDIGMVKPRQKRQYKKKKKKPTEEPKTKLENSPSPISIPPDSSTSGLPQVERIISSDAHQSKRCKTSSLERTLSTQTDILSPPAFDRAAFLDLEMNPPSHALSRTTTNTTLDPMEFGWPGRDCGFCQDGGDCLCLEKEKVKGRESVLGGVIEENGMEAEIDVSDLFKGDVYDEFLML